MLTSSTWISGHSMQLFNCFSVVRCCLTICVSLRCESCESCEVISVRKCPVLNAALASQPWRAGRRALDSSNSTEASARVRYGPTCTSPRRQHKTSNSTWQFMSAACQQHVSNISAKCQQHVSYVGHVASLFAKHRGFKGNHVISSDYTCSGTSECSTSAEAQPQEDFFEEDKRYMLYIYYMTLI